MNKIAKVVSTLALAAVAGCSAGDGPSSISAGTQDTAIFQQGMADVSGSNVGLIGTKTIALTFDDGPQRGSTDALLDFLRDQEVKATFFMVGQHIIGNEYLLERMSDEGMSIGNHTFDHTPIVKMSKTNMNGVYNEIAENDVLLTPHLRDGSHIFFRSPGGSWTNLIAKAMNAHPDIAQKYIGPVFWDIGGSTYFQDANGRKINGEIKKYDAETGTVTYVTRNAAKKVIGTYTRQSTELYAAADWDCAATALNIPTEMCLKGYLNEIERRQGGVLLAHDTHPRTIEMIKLLVPKLKELGYAFITLDELPNIKKFE